MTTIAGTTPYAWPYDGALDLRRAALLVVGSPDTPGPVPVVSALARSLGSAGGLIVQVTTSPPRRAQSLQHHSDSAPELAADLLDHRVASVGIDGFYGSPLDDLLRTTGREQLLLAGAWLEMSVHSTLRSANDRGYECLLVLDACLAHDAGLVAASRSQIEMSGGIFGAVGHSTDVLAAIPRTPATERTPA